MSDDTEEPVENSPKPAPAKAKSSSALVNEQSDNAKRLAVVEREFKEFRETVAAKLGDIGKPSNNPVPDPSPEPKPLPVSKNPVVKFLEEVGILDATIPGK